MVYQKPYFDPGLAKSSKYPDLFINPVASPSSYAFDGGVDVYPVDIVNSIPDGPSSQKFEVPTGQQRATASNNIDLENMIFGKSDMDFGSFLSMLTPDNKFDDSQTTDSSSYLIPNLDFLSEPSPQQLSVSDGCDLSPATAMQPFGTYDVTVMENSTALPPATDEQTFWEGVEKDSPTPPSAEPVLSPPASLPLSLDSASPMDDPFMAGLLSDEQTLNFPTDESRYYQTATPSLDNLHAALADEPSPLPVSAQSSPVTPATETGAAASWDDNLQELFEKTIDLSDMMELDFMMPPPAKRRPDDDLALHHLHTGEEKEWLDSEPSPREMKVEPISPQEVESPLATTPVEVDATSERGGGGKGKSTILFGKHEDEIIHKLLSPQPGVHRKPISRDKLVSMPVEEFNQLLEQASLTEIEVAFMKEWRRRGKNKAAAQIARKRKREEVTDLDSEVKALRKQKAELNKKYDRLRSQIATLKKRSIAAEDRVYRQQTKLTGKTVSRDTHLIHLTDDDKLLLVPRISSQVLTINK